MLSVRSDITAKHMKLTYLFPRELARAERGLLVAPTTESQNARFGPRVTLRKTIWIVTKVCICIDALGLSLIPRPTLSILQAADWSDRKIEEKLSGLNFQVWGWSAEGVGWGLGGQRIAEGVVSGRGGCSAEGWGWVFISDAPV